MTGRNIVCAVVACGLGLPLLAQTPALVSFDVISIKRSTTRVPGSNLVERPDGGMTMTNFPVQPILNRAFGPAQVIGMPDWVRTERYDIRTTSSRSEASLDERKAMLRALLVDRFRLVTHTESHREATYELVMARSDRRLGPGLTPSVTDCDRAIAATADAPQQSTPPDFTVPPSCSFRAVEDSLRDRSGDKQGSLGDLLEGEGSMDRFAAMLRPYAGRAVSNKTALSGTYRVRMNLTIPFLHGRGVDAVYASAPALVDALQEQLGLKLQPASAVLDVVVIDQIERPTED